MDSSSYMEETLETLNSKTISELKKVAQVFKVPNYSKYRAATPGDREKLAELVYARILEVKEESGDMEVDKYVKTTAVDNSEAADSYEDVEGHQDYKEEGEEEEEDADELQLKVRVQELEEANLMLNAMLHEAREIGGRYEAQVRELSARLQQVQSEVNGPAPETAVLVQVAQMVQARVAGPLLMQIKALQAEIQAERELRRKLQEDEEAKDRRSRATAHDVTRLYDSLGDVMAQAMQKLSMGTFDAEAYVAEYSAAIDAWGRK